MVQDVHEFRLRQPDVQRHHDAARLNHAVIPFDQLMIVKAEICDTVAGLDAKFRERRGQRLTALSHLTVRELAVSANDAHLFPEQIYGAVQTTQRSQGNEHSPLSVKLL